ncbi:MAG: nucleotidyltransferase domain-containing protein [Candidatus Krumholzibacteriia bacterium]
MLDELFGSKLRAKLIGWFMVHADERYFVRQLTSLIKEDPTNVSRELTRLARLGILESSREGRQKYYRVNRSSPFFQELRGLAIKTIGIRDVVRAQFKALSGRIEVAFIFGSFAEGRETSRSDIDIMVIGEASFSEVCEALRPTHEIIGREINPTVYPQKEFKAKLKSGHHFLKSILSAKKTFLIGDENELERLAKERRAR